MRRFTLRRHRVKTPGFAPMSPRRAAFARAAARGAGALALASVLACGGAGDGPTSVTGGFGTGTGGSGTGGGGSQASSALVGRWNRIIYFYDAFGSLHSSETEWLFAADGSAARTVITRNLSEGFADAAVLLARWRVEGSEVVITYQPPNTGTVRFGYRFEASAAGTLLFLGETQFVRVAP